MKEVTKFKRFRAMKNTFPVLLLLLTGASTASTGYAQFGTTITSMSFVAPTSQGVYSYELGQLAAVLETDPTSDQAHVFLDSRTGRLQSALRLDLNHRVLMNPTGSEILVTGFQSVDVDPGQPKILQPVHFVGRYNPQTLQAIEERQIGVDRDSGYSLTSQVAPNGDFLFVGSHASRQVNLIARYREDFSSKWGTELTYGGRMVLPAPAAYPLSGGTTGFLMPFLGVPDDSGKAVNTNVVGLLGGDGSLLWSGVVPTRISTASQEDFRYVFEPDGSLFGSLQVVSFVGEVSDRIGIFRVRPDGTLGFGKTVIVPGAAFEWQYSLGSHTLLCFTFRESGAHRVKFITIDPSGNVIGTSALNCQLRGGGRVKFTAARRRDTDYAFIRMDCGFVGISPQQTLARLHLPSGAMDFHRLPSPAPGVETFEIVTTPKGDINAHNNPFQAFTGITTCLVGTLNAVNAGGRVGFYELPENGGFPTCIPLLESAVTLGTPLAVQVIDSEFVRFGNGASVVPHTMPGMTAPLARPTIQPLVFTEAILCSDDAAPETVELSLLAIDPNGAELRFNTQIGVRYILERSSALGDWVEAGSVVGTGFKSVLRIQFEGNAAFFRCRIHPSSP